MLGPFEVRIDCGAAVPLGGLRQRALLAVLALRANEVVSTDKLIDELWGEHAPTRAVHTVQVFISRLRGALGTASVCLRTWPSGYALELDPANIDATRCERLYEQARSALAAAKPEAALTYLREAQALWRGPPLSEFTYELFAQAPIARLEELRVSCREELIEAQLEMGRHAEVISDLEAFVREQPFRERPRAQLMLALYRCGRQVEALDELQRMRRMLVDELGVEPGTALRELEQAILRHDESLQAPRRQDSGDVAQASVRRPKPDLAETVGRADEVVPPTAGGGEEKIGRSGSGILVGRDEEQQVLLGALQGAAEARPGLVLIIGEPGIGKTRLVRDLAECARNRQSILLWGECLPLAGEEFPYAPIAAALRGVDRVALREALCELPVRGRRELTRAFPDLAHSDGEDDISDAPVPQSRLFGWIFALLRALCVRAPALLVIEDIHWADQSTRDFLQYLIHDLRQDRLVVVATSRHGEGRRYRAVRQLTAELCRDERVVRIDLPPLALEDVALQLEGLLGRDPPAKLVDNLFTRSDGNPFYVEALLETASVDGTIPPTIRDALLVIVEDLSTPGQDLVRACAVIGHPVGHETLRTAVDLARTVFGRALRETIENHVLIADPTTGAIRVRHTLLAETVRADLNPAEDASVHAAIARALQAAAPPPHPSELAWHWEAAGQPLPALRAWFAAGRASSAAAAHHEAITHFAHARELWDRCTPADRDWEFDRVDILRNEADACRWTGNFDRAFELCSTALEAFDHVAQPARAAALYERLGRYRPWDNAASRMAYARALELLGSAPTVQRARLLVDDALALIWDARWNEAMARAEEALRAAQEVGTPTEEGSARAVLGLAMGFLGDAEGGERELRTALDLVDRSGSTEELATVRLSLGEVLRLKGDAAAAAAVMDEGASAAARDGADSYANFMLASAADDLLTIGRWEEAGKRLEVIDGRALSLTGRLLLEIVRGRLSLVFGRIEEAGETLEAAGEMAPDDLPSDYVVELHKALAELELARGRPESARDIVSRAVEAIGDRNDPLYLPALLSLGVRVEAELADSAGGDTAAASCEHADVLLARLRSLAPPEGRSPESLPIVHANLAQSEAEIARIKGESAPDAWNRAAKRWSELGQMPACAYARLMEARTRVVSDPDRVRAVASVRAARAAVDELGAATLLDRVEVLERLAGAGHAAREHS